MTLAIATLGTARLAGQTTDRLAPPPWPPELGAAFQLYYSEDFLQVQRLCQQVRAATPDAHLRREAAALAAMATMRLPTRSDRITGRAQLAQLAHEDSSLLTRPECQLAYGICQTALSETASALYHLSQAAEQFANLRQTDRLAEALAALAQAWARHGEWELAVPGMEIPQPDSRAEADRIRGERIRGLRERLAGLPGCEAYLELVDLILARHLLTTEGGAAEGLTLLEELARRQTITRTTAEASLALAERYDAAGRWTDAARLYTRIQTAGLGELSRRAEMRRRAIQRPQLVLEVPRQVAVGERVHIRLRARNVGAVEFEVRRVDLSSWLEQRQGRFAEAALPVSGALVAARNLNTVARTEHDWWDSGALDQPLTFDAPPGALVVVARAAGSSRNAVSSKRLVLGGDLQAALFIGSRRAAIWATGGEQPATAENGARLRAEFWMYGSFVATRPSFTGGTAVFPLPPEARLLRDKRWVCLVQVGEQVALCYGTLPATSDRRRPAVALIGGPRELDVGGQLHVLGVLLGEAQGPPALPGSRALELTVYDTLDRLLATTEVAVTKVGTFSAHLPISQPMEGKNLLVSARLDGQVLQNVFPRLAVRVADADATPLRVRLDAPSCLPPKQLQLIGEIEAAYPWGVAVSEATAILRFQAVSLPVGGGEHDCVRPLPLIADVHLDAQGRHEFVQPISDFGLSGGPLAVGVFGVVSGWDGRSAQGSAEVLLSSSPAHLWLRCQTDSPRVGEPLYVSLGWFDPAGRAAGARPTVAVRRAGKPITHLKLLPTTGGLRSAGWRPTAPGPYEIVATLPLDSGDPITVTESIHVADDPAGQPDATPLHYQASFTLHDDQPHVRVQLNGTRRHPLLVLLGAGDLQTARQLPALDGVAELLLPLSVPHEIVTHLVLAALGPDGARIIGTTEVQPDPQNPGTLELSADLDQAVPGATLPVEVSCPGTQPDQNVTLMARLTENLQSGGAPWLPGEPRADQALMPAGIQVVSPSASAPETDLPRRASGVIPETRELPARLVQALLEGPTLWVDTLAAHAESAVFEVPVPPRPGLYRLMVVAHAPGGRLVYKTLDLDTRSHPQLRADVPQQLMPGDRATASLVITNDRPTMLEACVAFDGGGGLLVDELRALGESVRLEAGDDGASGVLSIPPLSTCTLAAAIEAKRPGAGVATFEVETEWFQRRATASYTVYSDAPSEGVPSESSQGRITLRRTLFRWPTHADLPDGSGHEGAGPAASGAPHGVEIGPDARLSLGHLVLVREESSLDQPLEQVEWTQRLPGNCHTHADPGGDLHQFAQRRELRLAELTSFAPRLNAGQQYTHEYVIVAVRPGAFRFPPPLVRSSGVSVPVEVAPAAQRMLVADSD